MQLAKTKIEFYKILRCLSVLAVVAAAVYLAGASLRIGGAQAFTANSITPNYGDVAGGTPVTIVGNDFAVQVEDFDLTSVAAGNAHSCATASNGRAYCWGNGSQGRLGNGGTAHTFVPTSIDMTGALGGKTVLQVTAGSNYSCAIASDNLAYCWGRNNNGQLGRGGAVGSTVDSLVPVAVDASGVLAGKTIKQISAGGTHTCVIADDDKAYCWGTAGAGRLGNGQTTPNQPSPVAVTMPAGKTFKQIGAGNAHTCALTTDDLVYCWGQATYGKLGNNTTSGNVTTPAQIYMAGALAGVTFAQLSVGYDHNCAISTTGTAYCWGYNGYGQVGDGTTTYRSVATAVDTSGVLSGKTIKQISAGLMQNTQTCAIASDDLVYCWGYNSNGQLGNGVTAVSSYSPVAVDTSGALAGVTYQSVSSGGNFVCAMSTNNDFYCWGFGTNGQLGNNSSSSKSIPTMIFSPSVFMNLTLGTVSAGYLHTCAIGSDDKAYCWGNNGQGRLGNGTTTARAVPSPVSAGDMSDSTVKAVSAGSNFTCAIGFDDLAYCWGQGTQGQIGNGSTAAKTVPTAVSTGGVLSGKTIKQISTGVNFACAIASDDKAYCWGQGANGKLGNNATASSSSPVAVSTAGVMGGKTITNIATGNTSACAVASDGSAYCWGAGTAGQLGNGASANSLIPVAVTLPSGKTFKQVEVGNTHACALTTDGLVYCWGNDTYGQLGNDAAVTPNSNLPVAVDTSGVLGGVEVASIDVGNRHTCAVDTNGGVYCWGYGTNGQLGNNSTTTSNVPVAVVRSGALSGKTVLSVSAGGLNASSNGSHTCVSAINDTTAVRSVHCWGYNANLQLGDGTTISKSAPSTVSSARIELPFKVMFDEEGTPAECLDVIIAPNGKSITCTTSAHPMGVVSVTIDDGVTNQVMTNAYTYRDDTDLTLASITPNYGPVTGGTEVRLTGTNFSPSMTVTFDIGGTAALCANYTYISLTEATCETPAHVAGLVSVTADNGTTTATRDPAWIDPTDPHYEDNVLSGFLFQDPPYISLSVDKDISIGSLTPTPGGIYGGDSHTVSVNTNVKDGYTLSVSTNNGNSNLAHASGATIGPVSGTLASPSTIASNTWGFSLESAGNDLAAKWVAVPNVSNPLTVKTGPPNEGSGDQTVVYFGTKVDTTKVSGLYQATIVYTAVSNI